MTVESPPAGSGKTVSYVLPMIIHICQQARENQRAEFEFRSRASILGARSLCGQCTQNRRVLASD